MEVSVASHYEKTDLELALVPPNSPAYTAAHHAVGGVLLDLDGVVTDTAKLHEEGDFCHA